MYFTCTYLDLHSLLSINIHNFQQTEVSAFTNSLWGDFFKTPIDSAPLDNDEVYAFIRNYFFKGQWYDVYDFLEFTINHLDKIYLNNAINQILERELSGYRFVNGIFTDIIDKQEIDALEEALLYSALSLSG